MALSLCCHQPRCQARRARWQRSARSSRGHARALRSARHGACHLDTQACQTGQRRCQFWQAAGRRQSAHAKLDTRHLFRTIRLFSKPRMPEAGRLHAQAHLGSRRRRARRAHRSAAGDPGVHQPARSASAATRPPCARSAGSSASIDQRGERSPARAREEGLPAARGHEVAGVAPDRHRCGPQTVEVPILGKVAAGQPLLAVRNYEDTVQGRPLLHRAEPGGVRPAGQGRLDDRGRHLRRRLRLRPQAAAGQRRARSWWP